MELNDFLYNDLDEIADYLHSERTSLNDTEVMALLTNICRTVHIIKKKQDQQFKSMSVYDLSA